MGRITLGASPFAIAQTGFSNVLDVIKANTKLEAKEAVFTGDVEVLGQLSASLDASDIANLDLFLSSNIDFTDLINNLSGTSLNNPKLDGDISGTSTAVIFNSNLEPGETMPSDDTSLASCKAIKTFVDRQVSDLVNSAPGTLDTLDELAAALNDDANLATTITTTLGLKQDIDSTSLHILDTSGGTPVFTVDNTGLATASKFTDGIVTITNGDIWNVNSFSCGGSGIFYAGSNELVFSVLSNTATPFSVNTTTDTVTVSELVVTTITNLSDRRIKKNIEPTKLEAVNIINNIECVEFERTDLSKNTFNPIGFIAQDIQKVLPYHVEEVTQQDSEYDTLLGIKTIDLVPLLVKAVQELSARVNELEARLV